MQRFCKALRAKQFGVKSGGAAGRQQIVVLPFFYGQHFGAAFQIIQDAASCCLVLNQIKVQNQHPLARFGEQFGQVPSNIAKVERLIG